MAVEFITDPEQAEEINRVYLKEVDKRRHTAKQIVNMMHAEGFKGFNLHHHTALWKQLDAKNAAKGFGRMGDYQNSWIWYDSWIERVRAHCQENVESTLYRLARIPDRRRGTASSRRQPSPAHLPRRFPVPLADRREHLRRFRSRRCRGKRCSTHGQRSLAPIDGGTVGEHQIGLSFRRSGIRRQVHSRGDPLATLHSAARRRARTLLALRWLGHSGRTFCHRRSLSQALSRGFAPENRTGDQHDAYSIAGSLRRADHDGGLAAFLKPVLMPSERTVAQVEGWILGVNGIGSRRTPGPEVLEH